MIDKLIGFLPNIFKKTTNWKKNKNFKKRVKRRAKFIQDDLYEDMDADKIIEEKNDLLDFISNFDNSKYFTENIDDLIGKPFYWAFGGENEVKMRKRFKEQEDELKKRIDKNKKKILKLVDEFIKIHNEN